MESKSVPNSSGSLKRMSILKRKSACNDADCHGFDLLKFVDGQKRFFLSEIDTQVNNKKELISQYQSLLFQKEKDESSIEKYQMQILDLTSKLEALKSKLAEKSKLIERTLQEIAIPISNSATLSGFAHSIRECEICCNSEFEKDFVYFGCCTHSVCYKCKSSLRNKKCPYCQNVINKTIRITQADNCTRYFFKVANETAKTAYLVVE